MTINANNVYIHGGGIDVSGLTSGGMVLISGAGVISVSNGFIQTNGGAGPGGTIAMTSASDTSLINGALYANGQIDGGKVTLVSTVGSVNLSSSTVQTNGSNGRGGTIDISGYKNTQILGSSIAANGYTQGGTVHLGYNSSNPSSIPFSQYINFDAQSSISAVASNGVGGFIETSGHYVTQLLGKVTAGGGGTWLIDPYDYTIDGNAAATIMAALNAGGNVTIDVAAPSSAGIAGSSGTGIITINSTILSGAASTLTLGTSANPAAQIVLNASISLNNGTLTMYAASYAGVAVVGAKNINLYATEDASLSSSFNWSNGFAIYAATGKSLTISGGLAGFNVGVNSSTWTGTVYLTGSNTSTGGTWINGGQLRIRAANALGSGAVTVGNALLYALESLNLARNVVAVSGAEARFAAAPDQTLTLSGVVSGAGH